MRCEKAKRRLPLYAGGDLSARKVRRLQAHLERCPVCTKEAEEYRAALGLVRNAAQQAITPNWDEAAWSGTMARIAAEKPLGERSFGAPVPRWAFAAAGLGVVLLAALALSIFKDTLFRQKDVLQASLPVAAEKDPRFPDSHFPVVETGTEALKGDPDKTATGLVDREAEAGTLPLPRKPDPGARIVGRKSAAAGTGDRARQASRFMKQEPVKGDLSSKRESASRESSLGAVDIAKPAGTQDPEAQVSGAGQKAASVPQDVLTVTLVSQETGLQIAWFFHKEFDWKGDEK